MSPDKRHPTSFILAFLGLLLVVPLLAYGVIQLEGPRVRREALADLDAIGQLKTHRIESWLAERRDDAHMLMTSDGFVEDAESWFEHPDPAAEARLAGRLAGLRRVFPRWTLLDARAQTGLQPGRRALVAAALASGQPRTSDLYRDGAGQVWLDLAVPLVKPGTGEKLGALVLGTRARDFLFPFVQTWPTPSPSAETLLVRRDGERILFLSELRHGKGMPLTLGLPLDSTDLPAAIAARAGKAQAVEGRDYRGVPVLAAVRPVTGTPWFLVTKVDREEVLRPLYKLVAWVGVVSMAAVLAVATSLLLLWRQQRRNHRLELLARTGERDRLLSLFYDLPFMGMAIVDPDGRWLHVNDCLCEMLGFSREELLATTWVRLTHPDDLVADLAEHRRMLAGETDGYRLEKRFVHKDGSPVDTALSVKCVRRPDGGPEYIVKTVRDIGERKRLDEARGEQQRVTGLLDAIAAASTDVIFAKDTRGNYLFYNNEAARELDRRPEDVVGHDDLSIYPGEQAARIMAQDREIMAGGEARTFEEELPTVHGPRVFLTTKGPLRDGDGRAIGLYGISRDITARKLTEERILRSQEQLQLFIEHAPISIAMFDRDMNTLAYSRRWLEDFGRGYDSLAGRNHYAVHPDMPPEWRSIHQRGLAGETLKSDADHWVQADGSECWLRWAVLPWRDAAGMIGGIIISVENLTDRELAVKALADSQARLAGIIDSAMDAIITLDEQQRVRTFNPAAERMFGFKAGEMVGEVVERLIPPSSRGRHGDRIRGFSTEGTTSRGMESLGELRALRRDGVEFPIEASISRVSIGGELIFTAIVRDISERKAADAALRYQLDLIRGITEKSTDSIFICDAVGRVTAVNPEAERVFGHTAGELAGRMLHDVIHHHYPDGRPYPASACPLCHVYRGGATIRDHEAIFFHKNGSPLVVTGSNSAIESGGQRVGATLVLHDVTAQKRTEKALRDREEDLKRAQAVGRIGSWRLDIRRNELTWSEENHRIFEVPVATPMTYETFLSCVHPDDRAYVDGRWRAALAGEPYDIEHRLLVRGKVKWVRERAELEFDADGTLLGGFGTTQDISELKATEQALEAARAAAIEEKSRLETVMQTLPVGVAIVDNRGGTVRNNADYDRIWRGPRPAVCSVDDYAAFKAWWVDSGKPVEPHEWASAAALRTGRLVANQLLQIQRFDGSRAYVLNSAAPIRDTQHNIIGSAVVIQDITELKQAEQALRDSEERFQLSSEIGRSGTWDWNVLTGEVFWSRGHYEILGYRVGEATPGYDTWVQRVHPEDRPQIEAEIRRCMAERIDYAAGFRVVWPDGSVHWMSARGRYEYGEDGVCRRMLGVMADVTGIKQAELALREADQRKDEFLAMLAHELRNPLAPIRNAAHVLGRLDVDEPRVRWAQEIIERQVAHLTHLVDELLDVSRIARGKVSLKMARFELDELLRQACESAQPLMSDKGHRFEVRRPDPPVMIEGDLVRLVQVLQNLLNNAAKYTPDGGHIELTSRVEGREIEIQVRDNGMGLSADLLAEVFDLFRQGERTLDRSQGGLGIGLTLVRRLVELHGGRVEARSAGPGQGATFTVRLPVPAMEAAESAADEPAAAEGATGVRVLVVDDDPVVAESMVVFLELEGHQARSADSGDAALRLLPEFRPQVVLLDIGLPGQNGYEVARRIRRMPGGADLELVAVSGYGDQEAVERGRQAGFDRHLVKPVDPGILDALLAEFESRA